MNLIFSPRAWYEYTGWQLEDRKTLRRINLLIKDIERNGNTGIGKPEPLRDFNGYWSRRINVASMGSDPMDIPITPSRMSPRRTCTGGRMERHFGERMRYDHQTVDRCRVPSQ